MGVLQALITKACQVSEEINTLLMKPVVRDQTMHPLLHSPLTYTDIYTH